MEYAPLGSFLVALAALLISIYNGGRKDVKEESEEIAKVIARLDGLASDVREIKDDFRREMYDMKAVQQADHDRIIKVEISLDTAWKRIRETETKYKE